MNNFITIKVILGHKKPTFGLNHTVIEEEICEEIIINTNYIRSIEPMIEMGNINPNQVIIKGNNFMYIAKMKYSDFKFLILDN